MDEALNKWLQAVRNFDHFFELAIVENQEEILDSNIAQLKQGKDSLGNFLMEYASDAYAQFKKALGSQAPFGIPDLLLEGDFHEGFTLMRGSGGLFITSTDEKAAHLESKYGSYIFGIAEDQQKELNPGIAESFIKYFRYGLL